MDLQTYSLYPLWYVAISSIIEIKTFSSSVNHFLCFLILQVSAELNELEITKNYVKFIYSPLQ